MTTLPRVALLVDGENLSSTHAGALLTGAREEGDPIFRRVYGDVGRMPGWAEEPDFHLIHSGTGKNAADLLLVIGAMEVMLKGRADVLVIASSDRDFSHLAIHLREAGLRVVGMGERKATGKFRTACSHFVELAKQVGDVANIPQRDREACIRIRQMLDSAGSLKVVVLGSRLGSAYKVKGLGQKTWRAFLNQYPRLFTCDGDGPEATVRLAE